jgi:eukaryotic-like serine/threonine-protein kinase
VRSERVDEIFLIVCDLLPGERARRLDERCGDDAELRAEVESLLEHDAPEGDCLGDEAVRSGAPMADLLSRASADPGSEMPDRIGAFRVIEVIGSGGMGTVYLAEQDHPRRRVALKMIRSGVMSRALRKRFRAEAELLGRLQHPGIAQIYEAGETETGQPWFAMEYVEGRGIRDHVDHHGLDVEGRLELTARVADAIDHAHSRGVVHRDLKPDNILVVAGSDVASSQPKILDFGVARATESDVQLTTMHTDVGEILGTLNYMCPEQISGRHEEVDGRSDVYALGVILYELLAGRLPCDLRGRNIVEAAAVVEAETPVRLGTIDPKFRGDVETIVGKALEKEADRRYATAGEFAADIRRHLADRPIAARPPSARYQVRRFARRHRGLVAGLAAAFLILVIGVVLTSILAVRAAREAKTSAAREAQARRETYRYSLAVAQAVVDADPQRALRHLDDAPEEHRGLEWRLVRARCDSYRAVHRGDRGMRRSTVLARDAGGRLLACLVREGRITVFDAESGERRDRLPDGCSGVVGNLSPDGSLLTVRSRATGRLEVWRIADGARILEVPLDSADATRSRFSPRGQRLAVVLPDEIRVIEVATGHTQFIHPTGKKETTAVVFGPGGDRLLVAEAKRRWGRDDALVRLLDVTGEIRAEAAHGPMCKDLAVSPDGRRIAFAARRRVHVLDAGTLDRVATPMWLPDQVHGVAFSPDGRWLAASSRVGTVGLLDLEGGGRRTLIAPEGTTTLAFSGDGSLLAAGALGVVKVWEISSPAARVLSGHGTYVYQVAFSPDGRLLASSAWDDSVLVRDRWTGTVVAGFSSPGAWRCLGFTREGPDLLVCALGRAKKKTLDRRDPATGALRGSVPFAELDTPTMGGLTYCLDGGKERRYRPRGLEPMFHHKGAGPVWIKRSGVLVGTLDLAADEVVNGVAVSPDGARVVTGHGDGIVRSWDLATRTELGRAGGHAGKVYAIEFSPDGTRVVTGADDGLVLIRDAKTLEVLLRLEGHRSYVHAVAFSPDGEAIASASGDGTVRIWDATPAKRRPRESR